MQKSAPKVQNRVDHTKGLKQNEFVQITINIKIKISDYTPTVEWALWISLAKIRFGSTLPAALYWNLENMYMDAMKRTQPATV